MRTKVTPPVPITNSICERSAGGIHDFYSEGDYWWPNPDDPDGPYIRRDGKTNPENFTAHRKAMRNLNQWVSALVAAYKVSGEEKYAAHALKHLNAFFLDPETLMKFMSEHPDMVLLFIFLHHFFYFCHIFFFIL